MTARASKANATAVQPAASESRSGANGLPSPGEHELEAEWALTHPDALAQYSDQWVAVVGREIVAHAPTLSGALRAARALGHEDPLLVPVMPPDIVFME